MFDQPGKDDLIRAGVRAISSLVDQLDGQPRKDLDMALDALLIVNRELDGDHGGLTEILDQFSEIYGEDNVARSGRNAIERIRNMNKDLAVDIREGHFRGDDPKIAALMMSQLTYRLSYSNPAFLSDGVFSQPGQP